MDVGRNNPCPCGSGKKFKNCCTNKIDTEPLQGFKEHLDNQATALMATCLVSSMEVLRDKFGFTQEQLGKFADEYLPVLRKNLKSGER